LPGTLVSSRLSSRLSSEQKLELLLLAGHHPVEFVEQIVLQGAADFEFRQAVKVFSHGAPVNAHFTSADAALRHLDVLAALSSAARLAFGRGARS
jgi:hypothetical protein